MKSFGTHFKSLTANKFAYKALLEVFNTPHVYRVEIPCGASARCLVGPYPYFKKWNTSLGEQGIIVCRKIIVKKF